MKSVLIIDDEPKLRTLLARIVGLEGYCVYEARDSKTAYEILQQSEVDVILCDVKLPDGNGVEISKIIKEKYPQTEIIILTAFGNIPDGVQAIKNGAFDYITKGDDNNKIVPLINRAYEKTELSKRISRLENRLSDKYSFHRILGNSVQIKRAIDLAKRVASTDATVLLTGETGTGKEVFAQSIHQSGIRNKNNFVAINCSAISGELLENELFGHKIGAFTGAVSHQKGLFEEAHKGTIFFDEIGEMALDLQTKLLRVIETHEFYKIGENKPIHVDVRIIAATNRNLHEEVQKGNFREDLFYRISVFEIHLPPLRERIDDLELFINYFTEIFSSKSKKRIKMVSEDFIKALKFHSWKGNIRELKNIIERCVILADKEVLTVDLLPDEIQKKIYSDYKDECLANDYNLSIVERNHICKVLALTKGNKAKAAGLLGIGLTTLYRKLAEYNIS